MTFVAGALAPAGLPPFGTGLGKALSEDAAARWQSWLPAVFVTASAVTGAAALRAALRIFLGSGPVPRSRPARRRQSAKGRNPRSAPPSVICRPP
ncbi:hypothetical protein ACFXB3_02935 [Streptomyces sp. NPDC059447]|uniref:hypothetical protein n=1 Tax=Streptomyces sp. NPDC059447 TaxID=3346834 RepID=UPI00369164BD